MGGLFLCRYPDTLSVHDSNDNVIPCYQCVLNLLHFSTPKLFHPLSSEIPMSQAQETIQIVEYSSVTNSQHLDHIYEPSFSAKTHILRAETFISLQAHTYIFRRQFDNIFTQGIIVVCSSLGYISFPAMAFHVYIVQYGIYLRTNQLFGGF